MRTGIANLPLHSGRAPRWLFERMTLLSREICEYVVGEFGPREFLRKISDPYWFQAFGSVLGFDWHSSGLTTTACGALKAGLRGREDDLGIAVAGGKGRASRRTPVEIEAKAMASGADGKALVYASRMAAKVDSSALQDGYQIYHHVFFFTRDGDWAVIQQGMNIETRSARRYHWLSESVEDFVREPHRAICSGSRGGAVLNMVAGESEAARRASAELARASPSFLVREVKKISRLDLPAHHDVRYDERRLASSLEKACDMQPRDFEELLAVRGVGPKTVRALGLLSELVYGAPPSRRDPARYSFAHGGKDGHPYPVDRELYDRSISILRKAVEHAKLGRREKIDAIRRLSRGGGLTTFPPPGEAA